jgi:DNA-binding CsgD family transcriptional regulator/ArsR family metal-binding transcriptional regulator
MRFSKFTDFSLRASSINIVERCWFAHFKSDNELSHLFPFIRAIEKEAIHFENPEYLQFKKDGIHCSLYPPNHISAGFFYDREEALIFASSMIKYFNDLEKHKSKIKPKFQSYRRLHVPDILRLLPLSNCGRCGFRTCMAFAGAVSRRKMTLDKCPDLPEPISASLIYPVFDKDNNIVSKITVDMDLADSLRFISQKFEHFETVTDEHRLPNDHKNQKSFVIGEREGIIFKLTGRETEVIRLMAQGFTNKEISQILKISYHTVKSHVVHIFNKLGVNDRTLASVWAAQNELI